jgi:2'-5' RNA ligase
MKSSNIDQMFSYSALSEYLIIALPYAEIGEEVREIKRRFFQSYGAYSGQNSCGHIRLMSFFQFEEREEKVLSSVQAVVSQIGSFEVFLNGFGFDGRSRDVYIDILNKDSLKDLYDMLRLALFNQLVSLAFLNPAYDPKMIIGQDLSPLQFLEAIKQYEGVGYANNFRISRLHILKRKAPFKVWESLTALPLAKTPAAMLGLYEE